MAVNLEDVPSLDLMHELLRRMKCSSKPDKRLILIGTGDPPPSPFFLLVLGAPWIPVTVPGATWTERPRLAAVAALDPPKVFSFPVKSWLFPISRPAFVAKKYGFVLQ
jgi:hypothetical protein